MGETLTADTTGIADADGLNGATFTHQWIRNDGTTDTDTDISGETASTYTLVASDEGKTVKVRVSFTDDAGHEETLTSEATAVVAVRPNTPATGVPAISGTAQVGVTLTADSSGIADADGLANVSCSYQWIASDGTVDTDISGETFPNYTLSVSDEGKTVKVGVSFTDDADNAEMLTSAATATVAARPNSPATGVPAIGGMAQVGGTLTADTTGIADADGLVNASFSYQWLASDGTTDTDITGATFPTYTLSVSDEGKTVKVRVSFTDDAGNAETLSSAATAAVEPEPNSPATGAPVIGGTARVGETLRAGTSGTSGIADADGLENANFSYRWIANDGTTDADISGATDSTYTLAASDEGKTIRVRISFTDDAGHGETLTSGATAAVEPEPNRPAMGVPAVNGTVQVGETLRADASGIADEDGLSNANFSYRWIRNNGNTNTDISEATDASYTLADADEGKTIRVRVSFTDDAGNGESLTSAATAAVVATLRKPFRRRSPER